MRQGRSLQKIYRNTIINGCVKYDIFPYFIGKGNELFGVILYGSFLFLISIIIAVLYESILQKLMNIVSRKTVLIIKKCGNVVYDRLLR